MSIFHFLNAYWYQIRKIQTTYSILIKVQNEITTEAYRSKVGHNGIIPQHQLILLVLTFYSKKLLTLPAKHWGSGVCQ